jgi:hypothetical protein
MLRESNGFSGFAAPDMGKMKESLMVRSQGSWWNCESGQRSSRVPFQERYEPEPAW